MTERVQKILREWGIASRREAEKMIIAGRIKINGNPVKLGDKADSETDKIELDGKIIAQPKPNLIYLLLNKPKGVICTCEDPRQRKTVLDLLPPELKSGQGIHPVGRLDRNSTGALILTNDGSLTLKLTHPRYHLAKTYNVWLAGYVPNEVLQKWSQGVMLEGKLSLPAEITIKERQKDKTNIEIILREGKNRQIRRIAENFGYQVLKLHRTAIGSLKIAHLASAKYRFLSSSELHKLR